MMATVYTLVPARRFWAGQVRETKIYRRIMAEIGRCMKAGGAVELEQVREGGSIVKHGDIVERISVRLDWPERATE